MVGEKLYGRDFTDWFLKKMGPGEGLARLAEESQVVLLPSKGFGSDHPSVRVSLANLNETDYRKIGTAARKLLDSYFEEYKNSRK